MQPRLTHGPALPAQILGIAYCLIALLSVGRMFDASQAIPPIITITFAAAALAGGIALLCTGSHPPAAAVHVAVILLLGVVFSAFPLSSALGDQLAASFTLVWVSLYTAWFFRPAVNLGYLAAIRAGFAGALLITPAELPAITWPVLVITASTLSLMTNYLVVAGRRLAETDQLTGLYQRSAFTAYTQAELDRKGPRGAVALAILDLDDFKQLNDRAGHSAGDAYLTSLAQAWLACRVSEG